MSPAEDPTATPASGPPAGRPPARDEPVPDVLQTVRAGDSDRNAVAERLRDAFADGRLDEPEFDVRMQQALTAKTRADLDGLLGDLGTAAPAPHEPAAPAAQTYPVDPDPGNLPNYGFSIAVMSGVERKGRWRVPEETTVAAVMGGACLDLRAATLTSQVTTIRAVAIMGGVEIVVPPGVRVEVNGIPLLGGGGRDKSVDDADLPSTAPLIRVQYLAVMGGIGVTARDGSERREAHQQGMEAHREAHTQAMEAHREAHRHATDAHRRALRDGRDAHLRGLRRPPTGPNEPPPDSTRSE